MKTTQETKIIDIITFKIHFKEETTKDDDDDDDSFDKRGVLCSSIFLWFFTFSLASDCVWWEVAHL